jgi:hypothetical protein
MLYWEQCQYFSRLWLDALKINEKDMSYNVLLLRREVKEQVTLDFLERPELIPNFTAEQRERLKSRLLQYGYQIENDQNEVISFNFQGGLLGITATLYANQLSFRSGFTVDGIFEISQTASEFADDDFVKLDLQNGSWE